MYFLWDEVAKAVARRGGGRVGRGLLVDVKLLGAAWVVGDACCFFLVVALGAVRVDVEVEFGAGDALVEVEDVLGGGLEVGGGVEGL